MLEQKIKNIKLICPRTKTPLLLDGNFLVSEAGGYRYPVVNGIPVLLNDDESLFKTENYRSELDSGEVQSANRLKKFLSTILPSITLNTAAKRNFEKAVALLPKNAKILIVGCGVRGKGLESIYKLQSNSGYSYLIIEVDVVMTPSTKIVCDCHDLPFNDKSFDFVVVQAVLEHVLEPIRCVSEIWRVLGDNGLVYGESPFMQQVHMREFDFTRFSFLGHRYLFKNFSEVSAGICCGPGSALAWAIVYLFQSFAWSGRSKTFFYILGLFFAWPLKYLDFLLNNRTGSYDAASAWYFLGKKSNVEVSKSHLLKGYRGF